VSTTRNVRTAPPHALHSHMYRVYRVQCYALAPLDTDVCRTHTRTEHCQVCLTCGRVCSACEHVVSCAQGAAALAGADGGQTRTRGEGWSVGVIGRWDCWGGLESGRRGVWGDGRPGGDDGGVSLRSA
jgi:hypothetical protein